MHFVELTTEAQEKLVIIFEDRMVQLTKYDNCLHKNWEVTKKPLKNRGFLKG